MPVRSACWLWFIVVGFLLLAQPASAQTAAERRAKFRELVKQFDTDGDGRLSAAERQAMRERVQQLLGGRAGKPQAPLPQTLVPGETDLYKLARGPHEVTSVATHMLNDAKRNKQIPLRLSFPKEDGAYPLVVLCHGALGSKDGLTPLGEFWASHGYVVIQPTFGDSISLMSAKEKQQVKSLVGLVNSSRVSSQWDDRPRDVSFILDSVAQVQADVPGLAGRIDPERIAVAGHSFGAHTTMMLSGMPLTHPLTRQSMSLADDRIKAAIAISPQGTGRSITASAYEKIAPPMLMITGDNDGSPIRGQENKAGAWRREAFDNTKPGNKYLLWIKDAHHGFGGINGSATWPGAGPQAPDQVLIIQSTGVAFLDAYLKQDAGARAYLQSPKIDTQSKGVATLTAK